MAQWTVVVVGVLGSAGCSDVLFLDTGDSLIASITPSPIYASPGSDPCAATVRLVASHGDGNAAKRATVQLWLAGPAVLTDTSVELSDDGTADTVCLAPLDTPGMVTLHARSGPIETTAMVEVLLRTLPPGGHLNLSATPVASTAPVASLCGDVVQAGCVSRIGRQSQISIQGIPSETLTLPPRTEVWLSTDVGWLSATTCNEVVGPASLKLELDAGAVAAYACFSDLGGTATLTTRSGAVTASTQIEIRAVPRSLVLVPTAAAATAGTAVGFTAVVFGCDDQGIANVPLIFEVTRGAFEVNAGGSLLVKTGADGAATLVGTARTLPLDMKAKVLGTQVSCQVSLDAQVAP